MIVGVIRSRRHPQMDQARADRGRAVVADGEGRDHPPTNEERAALEDDPFVRSLMEAFDAKALSIRM